MFLAQDIICVIIFNNLLQQLFFFFPLAQRDGKPVYPGQKSVSFLNNNINPKVSSSMNGMFHILKVSPVKKMCFYYCTYKLQYCFLIKGFLKEKIQEIQSALQHFVL